MKGSNPEFARNDLLFRLQPPKIETLEWRKKFAGAPGYSITQEHLNKACEKAVLPNPSKLQDGNVCLRQKRHTFTATAIFLLILSGPPKLRIRDSGASLRGEIDWVVILHVAVWALAGLWVLLQIEKRLHTRRPVLRLGFPQILSLTLIACLSVSVWKSAAPGLSAFKVYQIAVCFLFMQMFVELFGRSDSLKLIFWGNALLCGALAACALIAPDLVWIASDFNPDPSRLKGDLIADTGAVTAFAIILLLTRVRRIWRVIPLSLLGVFLGLLIFSMMRTAYLVMIVFILLALITRPKVKPLRQFACLACLITLFAWACGWLPHLSQYRDPVDISNLGDRIGLWHYLSHVTLTQSPWFGLGYYSASRIYGPQYNPGLGTAHSIFFEALSGGGVSSFVLLVALTLTLSVYAIRLLIWRKDRFSFAVSSLFIACVLFGSMGDEIDSGPVAVVFWYSAAVLPWLHELGSKTYRLVQGASLDAAS